MSDYKTPRPLPTDSAADPCVVYDNAVSFDGVINGNAAVTTYTGRTLLSLSQAMDLFGFGVAPFTFAVGGTLNSLNLLVSNSPADGFLYKYVGAGSEPIVVTAGTDPTIGSDWQAFAATSLQALSGLTEPSDLAQRHRIKTTVAEIATGVFNDGDLLELVDRSFAKVNITSTAGVVNGATILDAGAGKYGLLVIEPVMYTSQFGVAAGLLTAQNTVIQIAVDSMVGKWLIHDVQGITYISVEGTDIRIPSNSYIAWMKNSQFKAMPTSLGNYRVLYLLNTSNTVLYSPYIVGDKDEHTGTTFENGHCIEMSGCISVTLDNPRLSKSWGDGLYVTGLCTNTTVNNPIIDRCRRNGISLIDVDIFNMVGGSITNTSGTNPQAAVDLEPNNPTQKIRGVNITNLHTSGNVIGISVATLSMDATSSPVDVTITNHKSRSDNRALQLSTRSAVLGAVVVNDPIYSSSGGNGILFDKPNAAGIKTVINRPVIIGNNVDGSTSNFASAAIAIYSPEDAGATSYKMGNCEINEPQIYSSGSPANRAGIYVQDLRSVGYQDIKIRNPKQIQTFASTLKVVFTDSGTLTTDTGISVTDENGVLVIAPNGTNDILPSQFVSSYSSRNYTANGNARLSDLFPIGHTIKFTKDEPTYTLRIIPTLANALPTLTTVGGTLDTTQLGASITLQKYSPTSWRVINQVGTWVGT